MGLELRLAWRNVWRNPRRTALTIAATVFAVYLVVFFVGMAAGIHEKMIEDSVRIHSGHVTISGEGYLEERTLEHFVSLGPEVREALDGTPGLRGWAPRLVSFALLSKAVASQGVVIFGVDPEREVQVSTLPERVRTGRFLVSGGSMPTLGTSNPTLTIAALACKAVKAIHDELDRTTSASSPTSP